jgi:hypothetical protein
VKIKRPVLTALLVAVVLALAVMGYGLATARNPDEKPFIIYFTLIALPFAWFLIWIFLGAIAWWQDLDDAE